MLSYIQPEWTSLVQRVINEITAAGSLGVSEERLLRAVVLVTDSTTLDNITNTLRMAKVVTKTAGVYKLLEPLT